MTASFSYCGATVHILKMSTATVNDTVQLHSHAKDCYELHYIYGGTGSLHLNNERFPIKKGSLFIAGPNAPHMQMSDSETPIYEMCIYLVIKNADRSDVLHYFASHPNFVGSSNSRVRRLFRRIIAESRETSRWSENVVSALVIALISEIVKLYAPQEEVIPAETGSDFYENRSKVLDNFFLNENLSGSLEDFAKELGVCPRQAERIIYEAYGSTFKKLRADARMAKAASLLEAGNLTVEQCAQACGYASVTSFNKAFKQKYQITPKKYQLKSNS
ncbi:MAG: AraC family transcriptional regulator [Oscillospiraceae bacterium]|nr:AraC family transcriptional regulator [Oscillospiraceae bacterium]